MNEYWKTNFEISCLCKIPNSGSFKKTNKLKVTIQVILYILNLTNWQTETGDPGVRGAHAVKGAEVGPKFELDFATIRLRRTEDWSASDCRRSLRPAIRKLVTYVRSLYAFSFSFFLCALCFVR